MSSFNDKLKALMATEDKFIALTEFLKAYIENPDVITDQHPYYFVIQEVVPGLAGQYTRNQAFQIGVDKIIEHINVLMRDHEAEYQFIISLDNMPGSLLKTTMAGLKEYLDFEKLKDIKENYNRNEIAQRFFTTKAEAFLSDAAIQDAGSAVSVVDYLKKLIRIADDIEDSEDVSYDDLISVFEDIRAEIKDLVANKETLLNNVTTPPEPAELDYSDLTDVIRKKIVDAAPEEDKTEIIELVDELIEEIEEAYNKVVTNAAAYLETESKLNLTEDQTLIGLKVIYDELVLPLSRNEITIDDYVTRLDMFKHNLATHSSFLKHIMFNLVGCVNDIRGNLMFVEYVYKLLIKLSEQGLLPVITK